MKPQSTAGLIAKGVALVGVGGAAAAGVHAGVEHVSFLQQLGPIFREILAAAGPILIAWLARSPRR